MKETILVFQESAFRITVFSWQNYTSKGLLYVFLRNCMLWTSNISRCHQHIIDNCGSQGQKNKNSINLHRRRVILTALP